MNNWTGIGRLTKDPEENYIASSQMAVAKFTMAIDDGYGDKKRTNFIPVTVFGKSAENCVKYLEKGRMVAVEGKIQTGSYDRQDGTKAYTMDVIANRVEFIDWGTKPAEKPKQEEVAMPDSFQAIDEEVPF